MDAGTMAAMTGEKRTSLCGRDTEVETAEVVKAAGRMCGVRSQRCARLTAQPPPFEAR